MTLPPNFDTMVAEARALVTVRALGIIQKETAVAWAARAEAAYRLYQEGQGAHLAWLLDAEEYAHEAYEHASLSGDLELASAIRARLTPLRDGCMAVVRGAS